MKYFITGHTGFKGAWLCLLLKELGHKVYGYSNEVRPGSLFARASIDEDLEGHFIGDICDDVSLLTALQKAKPQVVIHMAAQSLVYKGFENPLETFRVNTEGTRVILKASQQVGTIKNLLLVTTDKVYRDQNPFRGCKESDPLGGQDPYSASKAAADIISTSVGSIDLFANLSILVARAGNVVGGGDDSSGRLLPEVFSAIQNKSILTLRQPNSVRPWQHVLDCLFSYVSWIEAESHSVKVLNFGPDHGDVLTALEVLKIVEEQIGFSVVSRTSPSLLYPEQDILTLDTSLSRSLGLNNIFNGAESIESAVSWFLETETGVSPKSTTLRQIREYLRLRAL